MMMKYEYQCLLKDHNIRPNKGPGIFIFFLIAHLRWLFCGFYSGKFAFNRGQYYFSKYRVVNLHGIEETADE